MERESETAPYEHDGLELNYGWDFFKEWEPLMIFEPRKSCWWCFRRYAYSWLRRDQIETLTIETARSRVPELRGSLQTFRGRIKASDGGQRDLQGPRVPRMSKDGLQVLSLDG